MRISISRVILALFFLALPSLALPNPTSTVESFYQDYRKLEQAGGDWMTPLLQQQKVSLEAGLYSLLDRVNKLDLEHSEYGPTQFLGIAPDGTKSFRFGDVTSKKGLCYVPVLTVLNQDSGPEKVRVTVILRQQGQTWKVVNFAFPAYPGGKAWDLKSSLKAQLKQT